MSRQIGSKTNGKYLTVAMWATFHLDIYRLEICQKLYMTGLSGRNFYTLKVRNLRLHLLKKKEYECIVFS